jgi:phosphoenolpyruvate-protein kinase (PTS system EI component)
MVTGLGPDVLAVAPGTELVLDGAAGTVDVAPAAARAAAVRARRRATVEDDGRPAVTRDGRRIGVLANVATAAEVSVALRGGAEGVGLLRTELAFLEAPDWPSEQQHVEMLEPLLAALHSDPPRPAIVRVLDFGADKAPPFLRDVRARGLELLLENAGAFLAQLRAILVCARRHQGVRVMLPLVQSAEEVAAARSLLRAAARSLGTEVVPPLGAMIETQAAVRAAPEIARCSDFLSIGTNDLTASVLGSDRFAAAGGAAHDPRVLRCVAHTVAAGHAAGRSIEVCGEAASEPVMVPLLVGLRVDQLSVGAARVPMVRSWVRELSAAEAGRRARSALSLGTAEHVASLCSREGGDGGGERLERSSGVHAVGA